MNNDFLVEMVDGSFVRKAFDDLRPEDQVVFDGPNAFARVELARQALDAEIAAAGGLEAWKLVGR